jgi:tRNA(fMet)-specific endonuclease VapC
MGIRSPYDLTLLRHMWGGKDSRYIFYSRLALVQFLSPLEVASFDRDSDAAYGRLRAKLEQKGTPIRSMDLLIAAHALSLAVRLVTNNTKKFRRVQGLRVENWV